LNIPNSKSNLITQKIYKSREECPHSGNFPNGGISHPLNLVTDTKRRRTRNGGGGSNVTRSYQHKRNTKARK